MVTQSQKMIWYHTLSLWFSLIMFTEAAADNVSLRNSGKVSNLPERVLSSDLILLFGSTTTRHSGRISPPPPTFFFWVLRSKSRTLYKLRQALSHGVHHHPWKHPHLPFLTVSRSVG